LPEVSANISDIESGLLHPEMGVVADATRAAIDSREWTTVDVHFRFIDRVFTNGDAAVRNAVYVSYLENVLLGESASEFNEARTKLPQQLEQALCDLEAHFEIIFHTNNRR
jgi:hypothetical protein